LGDDFISMAVANVSYATSQLIKSCKSYCLIFRYGNRMPWNFPIFDFKGIL